MIKFLKHTADIKFRVEAKSVNQVFEECAKAVSSYMTDDRKVSDKILENIEIEEDNLETLLYRFLEELLYLVDTNEFVVGKAEVKITDGLLKAKLFGDRASGYQLKQIKAPTYAEMYIKKVKSKWEAQVVMDV